jgi:hypothetical protein
VLIRLARSFGQALRRTCSPLLGTAARAALILTEIRFANRIIVGADFQSSGIKTGRWPKPTG